MNAIGFAPQWIISGLATLAGLTLAWYGLFRSRVGATPFCRRCNYNLTGRVGEICPECGAALVGRRAIAVGERRVSRPRLIFGLMFLAVGLGLAARVIYPVVRQINWYAYYPTSWVISDLVSGKAARSTQADAELTRRRKTKSLTANDVSQLSAACLTEMARPKPDPARTALVRQVAALMEANALSDTDRQKFVQGLVEFKIETRPQVIADRPMPVNVRFTPIAALRDFSVKATVKAWRVDGAVQQTPVQTGAWMPLTNPWLLADPDWKLYPPDPGAGRIEADLEIQVVSNALAPILRDPPFLRTLSAPIKVLPSETPNYIRERRSALLDETVRNGLILRRAVEMYPAPGTRSVHLEFFCTAPLSVALAFKVRVADEAPENSAQLIITQIRRPRFEQDSCSVTVTHSGPYTLILEPNINLAQSRSDVNEIWGGTLIFKDVAPADEQNPRFEPLPAKLLEVGDQEVVRDGTTRRQ